VNRIQKTLVLIAALAVPAAAHSTFTPAKQNLCFASGAATYQIARNAETPDFRVRVAERPDRPDLRMQLVDNAERADFVLVDDFSADEPAPCRSAAPVRTVALDTDNAKPDVTVRLTAEGGPADYRIYVHSVRFSHQDAAAILAAMWKSDRQRELTGSIGQAR